ncbi:DUF397 domain-containing protein [Streptomyces iconiensis]|uniref:DUF397 domain-containing protein n=1 Tax=Streptomyces iconiensis TaxID=1384038 RepID=A0ABT6ZS03_9ACTN|nr:DUF397 domain-containing protein [Streptomyces iconiensis]MDJ1131819.1 DUF397 domain-containing protein [Streptomyces iconiensis]
MPATQWISSSYSDNQGGQCVEWAPAHASAGSVPVRDSKDTSRTPLSFSPTAWSAFIKGVRTSEV